MLFYPKQSIKINSNLKNTLSIAIPSDCNIRPSNTRTRSSRFPWCFTLNKRSKSIQTLKIPFPLQFHQTAASGRPIQEWGVHASHGRPPGRRPRAFEEARGAWGHAEPAAEGGAPPAGAPPQRDSAPTQRRQARAGAGAGEIQRQA